MQLFFLRRLDRVKCYAVVVYLLLLIDKIQCDLCEPNEMSEYCDVDRDLSHPDKMEKETSLAVVVYREEAVLPLHKLQRTFRYCGHDFEINQDWSGLGVAAVVWDAAEVLAKYLESKPELVKDKSVIELGAGTGLVGMVAALLGARTTITDRSEVLDFLTETVHKNLPAESLTETTVAPLDWTKDVDKFNPSYDVILGADIVYIEEVFNDLLKTLTALSTKETVIFLSCRIRYDRDTNFLSRLEETFTVTKILYDKTKDVNLYQVLKR